MGDGDDGIRVDWGGYAPCEWATRGRDASPEAQERGGRLEVPTLPHACAFMAQVTTLREVREDETSRTSPARMRPHIKGTSRRAVARTVASSHSLTRPHMAAAAQSHVESAREQGKHVPFKDHDKTIMKVSSFTSPRGPHGEKYLASAKRCVGHCACAVMRMHHSHCDAQGFDASVGERAAGREEARVGARVRSRRLRYAMIHSICTILHIPIVKTNPLISLQSFPAARSSTSRAR